jgi:hypothetical protein
MNVMANSFASKKSPIDLFAFFTNLSKKKKKKNVMAVPQNSQKIFAMT